MKSKKTVVPVKRIPRTQWFPTLIGFQETEWDFGLDSLPAHVMDGMGDFTTVSLMDLEATVELIPHHETMPPIHLFTRSSLTHEEEFDTSSLQCKAPPNSIFQVASNFNCLEVSSTTDNPLDGTYLSFLMEDKTQGPSAMGGTGYGSIRILHEHHKQTISLLEDVDVSDRNGKLYESRLRLSDLKGVEQNYKRIKVGVLRNTRSIIDRNQTFGDSVLYYPKGSRIHQVLTSTCIVRTPSKKALEFQKWFLRVAYEAIYLLAIEHQSPWLVLTFVGGGVFKNDINTIIQVIGETHQKYSKYLSETCRVMLPVYMPRRNMKIVEQFEKFVPVTLTRR